MIEERTGIRSGRNVANYKHSILSVLVYPKIYLCRYAKIQKLFRNFVTKTPCPLYLLEVNIQYLFCDEITILIQQVHIPTHIYFVLTSVNIIN